MASLSASLWRNSSTRSNLRLMTAIEVEGEAMDISEDR